MKNGSKNTVSHTIMESSSFSRRDFMKLSGIVASALVLPYASWAGQRSVHLKKTVLNAAVSYLTPTFMLDNAARLSLGSDFIHAGLQHCLASNINTTIPGNAFRMGTVMPFGKEDLLPSLIRFKDQWVSGKQDQATAQRLAVLAGALTYQMVMAEIEKGNTSGDQESKVYQDATLLRNYLTKGKEMGAEQEKELHSIFRQMLPRTFTRFHTLMPDEEDGATWVMNIAAWRKQTDNYFGALAASVARPDPTKVKTYITDTHFFEGGDAILTRISTFGRVEEINRDEANRLLESAKNASVCAKALACGYHTLITLNDYMAGAVTEQEMATTIGKL